MINPKRVKPENMKTRTQRTEKITIDEMPKRPVYIFRDEREQTKFCLSLRSWIRSSMEYKDYIQFLKNTMDWRRCAILKNAINANGRRYTIEIHHEPFTLFDIIDTVVRKMIAEDIPIEPLRVAEKVMELHYDGKVGLINLTKTQHELVGNGQIFIPLQFIYHDYYAFYEEYKDVMSDAIKEKIKIKTEMSLRCDQIQSNVLTPEFVAMDVDGFEFPEVPEEWGKLLEEVEIK